MNQQRPQTNERPVLTLRKKEQAKGGNRGNQPSCQEKFLGAAVRESWNVMILLNDGQRLVGKLLAQDRYSVLMRYRANEEAASISGDPQIIYRETLIWKHAIARIEVS